MSGAHDRGAMAGLSRSPGDAGMATGQGERAAVAVVRLCLLRAGVAVSPGGDQGNRPADRSGGGQPRERRQTGVVVALVLRSSAWPRVDLRQGCPRALSAR